MGKRYLITLNVIFYLDDKLIQLLDNIRKNEKQGKAVIVDKSILDRSVDNCVPCRRSEDRAVFEEFYELMAPRLSENKKSNATIFEASRYLTKAKVMLPAFSAHM